MRRTLPLVVLAVALATGVGYGTSAASGPAPHGTSVDQLDTADRPLEPTGRTYLTEQPATAAPEAPTVITPTPTQHHTGTASGTTAVEAPAPAAVTPQPVPVDEPITEPEFPDFGEQYDVVTDERPTCPPTTVFAGINSDGSPICGAP